MPFNNLQKLLLLLALFCFASSNSLTAQCLNATAWGNANAPIDDAMANINTCNYAGEYGMLNNISAGSTYAVTSSNCDDYITIYDDGENLVAHGNTPVSFMASSTGTYQAHFNTDASCGVSNGCRNTNLFCISCGAVLGCTDAAATNYNTMASVDDCSCVFPTLSNDDCSGAIDLTSFLNSGDNCDLSQISIYSGASFSTDEIAPSVGCSDGDPQPFDVWYSLTVPTSGAFSFELLSTPGFSSVVELYTGTCGALVTYAPFLCNSQPSRTFTDLEPNAIVYIRLWDYGSDDTGNHELCVREEIFGCTDPQATNYNAAATIENGACVYPPATKTCNATLLTVNADCVVGDNADVGMEPGEPAGTCYSGENNSVWFRFVATSDFTNMSTDFTGYTSEDTEMAVYSTTDCTNYNTFIQMGCDQDGGADENYNSVITGVATTIGETYYIQVSGWDGSEGTFCLQVTAPPANDAICSAAPMDCGDVMTGNTINYAFNPIQLPTTDCGSGGFSSANAFYKIAGTGDDFIVSLCNSNFDTRLDVFCLVDGNCSDSPTFNCVAGNDDTDDCDDGNSKVSFATKNGAEYYILVHGYGENAGAFSLEVSCNDPVTPPTNQDCVNDGTACRNMGAAEWITLSADCNLISTSNMGAAAALTTPDCAASAFQTTVDVWYQFNSGSYTDLQFTVEAGSAEDLNFAIYDACGTVPLHCGTSLVNDLSQNTDYYLQIFTPQGNEGSFDLCLRHAPNCAPLLSPGNDEVSVTAPLTWGAVNGATGYNVQIGTTPGGDEFMPMTDMGNVLTYTPLAWGFNTTYYVQLFPYNGAGMAAACTTYSFTTACPILGLDAETEDETCYGNADGSIEISTSGGIGPYNYLWNGSGGFSGNTAVISDLRGGLYSLTVVDSDNACFTTANYVLQPNSPLEANFSINDATCINDGMIGVTTGGGVGPYVYNWSNGATTESILAAEEGVYSLTLTDALSCELVYPNLTVEAAGILAEVDQIANAGCSGNNGQITLHPLNGSGPYSYEWSSEDGITSGATNGVNAGYMIQELAPGMFTVTLSDANGCTGTIGNLAVIASDDLALNSMVLSVDCHAAGSGQIIAEMLNGIAPFQLNWSNGVAETTNGNSFILENIDGGNYGVTITDAVGCVGIIEDIVVEEPEALTFQIAAMQNSQCMGDLAGNIDIQVSGGAPPYSFLWNNGMETEDLEAVAAGTYVLTITDANACNVITEALVLEEPTGLEYALLNFQDVDCAGAANGLIQTIASGGTPPYSILWNTGAVGNNLDQLVGGMYQFTITDGQGCVFISPELNIAEPDAPLNLDSETLSMISCFGANDGSIELSVSGGTEPYAYEWSNGITTAALSDLSTGNYLVTVTDDRGCVITSNVYFIEEAAATELIVSATMQQEGAADGTATVTVDGGTPPFSYLWDTNAANQSTATATGLVAGVYVVTVTDGNGCEFEASVEIVLDPALSAASLAIINTLELFPNPTNGLAELKLAFNEVVNLEIAVFALNGQQIFQIKETAVQAKNYELDLTNQPEGVYLVKMTINGQSTLTRRLVVR